MKKIWLIIKREYITRVRKRAFLVTTILVPLLFVGAMVGIGLLSNSSEEQLQLAVKDDSGMFEDKIRGLDKSNLTFSYFGPEEAPRDSLVLSYGSMRFDGLLYIPAVDIEQLSRQTYLPQLTYYSDQSIGFRTKSYIESEMSEVIRKALIRHQQLDEVLLAQLESSLQIQSVIKDEAETGSMTEIATVIGYLTAFIIYIYLIAYGAMVMRSVMEEKTNRIVEVIITTVRPFQLMMGKILGIGAVGLTQLLIWGVLFNVLYFAAALFIGGDLQSAGGMGGADMGGYNQAEMVEMTQSVLADLAKVNWFRVTLSFLFYFLFGYIFYASQFAAIGAAAADDGDVQTLMMPITVPIIISIFIMMMVIEQPNSGLALWSSMIPFTSPVVMMSRIPFGISAWQQLLSMLILSGTALGTVWIAGKIYRIGILIQGQKPSMKKMWKWVTS